MSRDMSMFKKMKDKITDEVSSATSKLQNIQVIDQLSASIGQQSIRNEMPVPNQTLPEIVGHQSDRDNANVIRETVEPLSLLHNSPDCEEDEELNSELTPQHQLFNEKSISRLYHESSVEQQEKLINKFTDENSTLSGNQSMKTVIDFEHLSSDIEVDDDDNGFKDDVEIDLLSLNDNSCSNSNRDNLSNAHLDAYKIKYRDTVRAFREYTQAREQEKARLESHKHELTNQVARLHRELDKLKQTATDISSSQTDLESDVEKRSNSSSGAHKTLSSNKHINKIRDLEKLMAKCKESLKAKNSQLKILRDSLNRVDKFNDSIDGIKQELRELQNAHETWTLSIAENKRVTHQEIEEKNNEILKLKMEIKELHSQIMDSGNKSSQLKLNIQNLESRLVSMSAAHQKERDSLIREMTAIKNNAIKQIQREHELQVERIKLDLEKSIESQKVELINKDEQLIKTVCRQQELQDQNCKLTTNLNNSERLLQDKSLECEQLRNDNQKLTDEVTVLNTQMQVLKDEKSSDSSALVKERDELEAKNAEMKLRVEEITIRLGSMENENEHLKEQLKTQELSSKEGGSCESCRKLEENLQQTSDEHKQSMFELKTRLDLLTTANCDQEKALDDLKKERDGTLERCKSLNNELDDLVKKNESLSQLLQENEGEMQSQQEQLNQLSNIKQQLDTLKKENSSLSINVNQVKNELNDRINELTQSRSLEEKLKDQLACVEKDLRDALISLDSIKSERDNLKANLASELKKRKETDEQLVISILATMKNLETPDSSPVSDKTYKSEENESSDSLSDQKIPNPTRLAKELSSLALNRCNAYLTCSQRLQAVLLDNSMLSEELKRLKEELNAISKERSLEVNSSLQESERLRTENQALIHDQKAYDDHVANLEAEIETLKQKSLMREEVVDEQKNNHLEMLNTKEDEIIKLKELISLYEEKLNKISSTTSDPSEDVPDSTQFEYLKNIVYQFMVGREPLVLARVISAVFKFEREQVEQICKVQEAIHQVSG